jgi:hypothetical protein
LVPFQSCFSVNAKQTSTKVFHNALDRLTRQVELGLICSCQSEEARCIFENKTIANGGITPGSMPPFSKSIWEGGASIKVFNLVEQSIFQEEGIHETRQSTLLNVQET